MLQNFSNYLICVVRWERLKIAASGCWLDRVQPRCSAFQPFPSRRTRKPITEILWDTKKHIFCQSEKKVIFLIHAYQVAIVLAVVIFNFLLLLLLIVGTITDVPIFPHFVPLPWPSTHCCLCPWAMHTCFLANLFTFYSDLLSFLQFDSLRERGQCP